MSTMETENGATAQYVPFTPFQESYAFEAQPATPALLEQHRMRCVGPLSFKLAILAVTAVTHPSDPAMWSP